MTHIMEGETTRGRNDSGRNDSGRTGKWAKRPVTSAQIVCTHGNQLVPELLSKPSDTLHTQCRHIEHLHEEV